jgi:hypothetical protein
MTVMTNVRRFWALLAAGIIGLTPQVGAARAAGDQPAAAVREPAPAAAVPFAIRHPLPFKFGERLTFDVKFSRFPIHANVGQLTFRVAEPNNSDRHIKFEVEAVSKGALVSLFGISVHDVFTTLADRDDLFVYSTIKNLKEGDHRSRQVAVFDRTARSVRYTVSKLAPTQSEEVTNAEAPAWVQDSLSAFYFARTRKLKNEGREVAFNINDEAKTYNIGVAPVAREEVKTDAGTFKAVKVDVRIFNGRYVRREGQLFVWLTDDERRIPVKGQLKVPAGTVTFDLTSLEEGTAAITPSRRPAETAAAADE